MRDYRESHKDPMKGVEYHAKFTGNPYRSMMWRMEKDALDEIVSARLPAGFDHLDFACGTGRIIEHFQSRAGRSTGIDISDSMLAVAKERLAGCTFVKADITRDSTLQERSFGLVTAFRFFANSQDELRYDAMTALSRLLSDNGVLVFNNHKNRWSLVYIVGKLLRREQRDMSHSDVMRLTASSGLEILEVRHMGVLPATDRYQFFPIAVIDFLERRLSRWPFLRPVAANNIYVCGLARSGPMEQR